jgi:hypothetical protein
VTGDGKCPALFDMVLADAGISVVLSCVRMPRMNSIMECWIQACRHEPLDRTLIFNRAHLLHALREYEHHHNEHRPHRGIANARPRDGVARSITAEPKIEMLAVFDHGREPANLSENRFGNQVDRESFQLRQQDGDLPLVEDRIEEGAEPGEHREHRGIEVNELLGPFKAA